MVSCVEWHIAYAMGKHDTCWGLNEADVGPVSNVSQHLDQDEGSISCWKLGVRKDVYMYEVYELYTNKACIQI